MARYLLLILGVFLCSTAVIVLKTTQTHPLLVGTYRLLIAAFVLGPLFYRDWKRHGSAMRSTDFWHLIWPALFLAAHFSSWALGARLTLVANASLIINLAPIAMPLFAFILVKERVSWKEIVGTFLAIGGVLFLSWSDFSVQGENLRGNIVCFFSMLCFTAYLAFGRKYANYPTVWLYVTPVYAIAGVISFCVSLFFMESMAIVGGEEWGRIIFLAVVPTILGHTILNQSLKTLKGQVVSVVNLHQFVFATIVAFLVYAEIPSWEFGVAAFMCSMGAWIVVRESAKIRKEDS